MMQICHRWMQEETRGRFHPPRCTMPVMPATRGPLATDHVILNHGQVTWTTPELAPPLLTTTPHQREDVSALDRFNVHPIAQRIQSVMQHSVSTRTIRRRFQQSGMSARRPLLRLPLTENNTRLRCQWYNERIITNRKKSSAMVGVWTPRTPPLSAALVSCSGQSQALECLKAIRVGPPCEGSEKTQPRLSLIKSSSARLCHILLHTSVPFQEITPNKYPATEMKDVTHQKEVFKNLYK
ncbi:uncharacterized protein TNCV_790531 [Trichonephila clavipes]|nr:uncharacterized protein TNCV_790531 [Trichonephila clavipes]